MCSPKRAEVEAVKDELSRAGIVTEIRNNPTAEALGVTGIELWVKHERDFPEAANLYTKMQARSRGCSLDHSPRLQKGAGKPPGAVDGPQVEKDKVRPPGVDSTQASDPRLNKLEEDTAFLEKQLEEMLDFQKEVVAQCIAVRCKTRELHQALADVQAALCVENEKRAAAQEKQDEEVSALQGALQRERLDHEESELELQCERTKREQAEEQLGNSKTHEESLKKAQEKLEVQARLLQTHAAAVLRLRKEIEVLESQREEEKRSCFRLREDVAAERKARIAAEQRAEDPANAQRSLRLPSLFFRRLSTGKKEQSN